MEGEKVLWTSPSKRPTLRSGAGPHEESESEADDAFRMVDGNDDDIFPMKGPHSSNISLHFPKKDPESMRADLEFSPEVAKLMKSYNFHAPVLASDRESFEQSTASDTVSPSDSANRLGIASRREVSVHNPSSESITSSSVSSVAATQVVNAVVPNVAPPNFHIAPVEPIANKSNATQQSRSNYMGVSFGPLKSPLISVSGASGSVPTVVACSPMNPWYLTNGIPNFSKANAPTSSSSQASSSTSNSAPSSSISGTYPGTNSHSDLPSTGHAVASVGGKRARDDTRTAAAIEARDHDWTDNPATVKKRIAQEQSSSVTACGVPVAVSGAVVSSTVSTSPLTIPTVPSTATPKTTPSITTTQPSSTGLSSSASSAIESHNATSNPRSSISSSDISDRNNAKETLNLKDIVSAIEEEKRLSVLLQRNLVDELAGAPRTEQKGK